MSKHRFKEGQQVVALKSNPQEAGCQLRQKGKVYTVERVRFCRKCGEQAISIGTGTYGLTEKSIMVRIVCSCGSKEPFDGFTYTYSKHFAPLDDLQSSLESAVQEEDYELAVDLRDIIQNEKVEA
jgi:hypothetical protein